MKKQFIKTTKYGTWYYSDEAMAVLHREDGPAVDNANGDKYWYLNDERHREDGPAYEGANGDKYWYLNGERHREDGPAVEYADGSKEWYISMSPIIELTLDEIAEKFGVSVDNLRIKI